MHLHDEHMDDISLHTYTDTYMHMQCSPQAPSVEWPTLPLVSLTLMWEGNQLMWSQTPPKPRPPTLPQSLPGENPDM